MLKHPDSLCARASRGATLLAEVTEHAGHQPEAIAEQRSQLVLVGSVLAAATVGLRYPITGTPSTYLKYSDAPEAPILGMMFAGWPAVRMHRARDKAYLGIVGVGGRTGAFESNNNGTELSRVEVFASGQYSALERFNLGTTDLNAPDATMRIRGMELQITTPNGKVWRMALIDTSFIPAANPEAFYGLLEAAGSSAPDAMKDFMAAHPEFAVSGA